MSSVWVEASDKPLRQCGSSLIGSGLFARLLVLASHCLPLLLQLSTSSTAYSPNSPLSVSRINFLRVSF